MSDSLKTLGFDQYERHAVTRSVVERVRRLMGGGPVRILDIGGAASALARFLPSDRVIAIDVLSMSQGEYVRGTGAALPFRDASFDIATCHDTLEHVPADLRRQVVTEMARVAREMVLIQGPFDEPGVASAERIVMDASRQALGERSETVRFLTEHRQHGLPDLKSTLAHLHDLGFTTVVIPNGALNEWVLKMMLRDRLVALSRFGIQTGEFDRWSNDSFYAGATRVPTYRQLIVAARNAEAVAMGADGVGETVSAWSDQSALLPAPMVGEALARFSSLVEAGLAELEARLAELQRDLAQRDEMLARQDADLAEAAARLADTEELLAEREAAARYLWGELESIRDSLGYRLLEFYRRVVRAVFPPGSARGIPYRAARKALRLAIRSLGVVRREGMRAFLRKAGRKVARRWRFSRYSPEIAAAAPIKIPPFEKRIRPLAFPKVTDPKVSIIVPVYNKAIYTFNCLKSVLENSGDVPYEVIVVDDASTDETPEMLSQMENVRVLRNQENQGFLKTCNYGLSAVSGQYVVFLNNDTQVRPGWLSALVETIERDERIGIVGAKLIYPTGKLQEAGGIVWNDGSSYAYGRDANPRRPEFNFIRDVDYCSGACLLVRRDLLERVRGFDARFQPAYYEDTDLCFGIREMGYRVVFQPDAVVIHREGTSSRESSQTLQQRNRVVFREKWAHVLARDHYPPNTDPYLARDRSRGKRVLVVDYHMPTYDRGGGELRMFRLLNLIKDAGHRVTLLPADLIPAQPYTHDFQQLGIEVLYGDVRLEEFGRLLDVVIVSRPEVAQHYVPLVRRYAPQAILIYDTVDLHWIRESRRAEVEGNEEARREAARLREMELWAARACDATVVVSPVEKQILEAELPNVKVYVIPNVHPVQGRGRAFTDRAGLLFVGYYPHLPNRDAMLYFIRDIFPHVKKHLPDVKLYVVGPEPGEELERLAGEDVVVTGWVKDLAPYLEGCRAFVSPLRYGAGIKGKIGESMAHGLPVVTTSVGAEGMGLTDGAEVLIGDDPVEFAEKVVQLYCDQELWERLSKAGLDFVDRTYSPSAVAASLQSMMESVRGGIVGRGRSQCNICGSRGGFLPNGGHHKEGYACLSCAAISRDRMLISTLGLCIGRSGPLLSWQPDPNFTILETSGFRGHPPLLAAKFRYINLVYDDAAEHGLLGDLQRLPIKDRSVDVVLSADVFEHVRDDTAGFAEVYRILKDSGFFLLQVPALGDADRSRILVDASGPEDVYLAPPEYHEPHSLVYRYYGNDLADRLRSLGFQVLLLRTQIPAHEVHLQAILIAQKAPYLAIGTTVASRA